MVGYIRTTKRTVIEVEVSKNEIELMVRRNKYVQLPNDWELRDEMFNSLCNKTIIGSDDWIDSENWGSDSSENMFGELENYEDHILEILGFRRELVMKHSDDYPLKKGMNTYNWVYDKDKESKQNFRQRPP